MDREGILMLLAEHEPRLSERHDVIDLAVFGSLARAAVDADSDIDVLVAFEGPATTGCYYGVMFYREEPLGRPVHLATVKTLREELRPHVEREAVHL